MAKISVKIEYCVPPILAVDHVTHGAAHFLLAFRSNSAHHVRGVMRNGLRGQYGLAEEVAYWFDNCESDAEEAGGRLGYWDTNTMGPWTFRDDQVPKIAKVVWAHLRGWKVDDILSYGYTREDLEEFLTAIAQMR